MVVSWVLLTVGFLIARAVVDGFEVKGLFSAVVAAAIFGVLSMFLSEALFVALGFASFGLGFLWVFRLVSRILVNAILLKITDMLTTRLTIRGIVPAISAGVVISVVVTVGDWVRHPGTAHLLPRHFW